MSNVIKINKEVFREEVDKLSTSISDFRPYNKKFIEETLVKLEGSNSDFIASMEKVLGYMKDTKAPELLKKLEKIEELSSLLVDEFTKIDDEIATNTANRGSF